MPRWDYAPNFSPLSHFYFVDNDTFAPTGPKFPRGSLVLFLTFISLRCVWIAWFRNCFWLWSRSYLLDTLFYAMLLAFFMPFANVIGIGWRVMPGVSPILFSAENIDWLVLFWKGVLCLNVVVVLPANDFVRRRSWERTEEFLPEFYWLPLM